MQRSEIVSETSLPVEAQHTSDTEGPLLILLMSPKCAGGAGDGGGGGDGRAGPALGSAGHNVINPANIDSSSLHLLCF